MAYAKPLPKPSALTKPFWEGTRQHKLLLQRCKQCAVFRWTPLALCPSCYSPEYEWKEASGRGKLYSYSVIYRPQTPEFAPDVPYVLAAIRLDEGPLMMTNMTGCTPEQLRMEMPVAVQFEKATDEITLYKFRPAA